MKLDLITNKKDIQGDLNPNDEFYTPEYVITPIIKYLKPESKIWCPFDTSESNYVKMFSNNNFTVINTHIKDGIDFFKTNPPIGTNYIISNPPYSLKAEVFERLFNLISKKSLSFR